LAGITRESDRREIRYQRLVEEAPGVMMVLGPDLEVRYASRAVGRILGLDPRRVAGNPFSAYLHPETKLGRGTCAWLRAAG
jgi:PAS domain S-box-containing protein